MTVTLGRDGLFQKAIAVQELIQRTVYIGNLFDWEMPENFGPGCRLVLMYENKNRKLEICHEKNPFSER